MSLGLHEVPVWYTQNRFCHCCKHSANLFTAQTKHEKGRQPSVCGQTCMSKVYDVWARSLLISTLVSFNACLPGTNTTLSSHGWQARRSLLWHRRHNKLYDKSSRCPVSRGECHSNITDVWLTTETTLRGAEGTPGKKNNEWEGMSPVYMEEFVCVCVCV